MVRPLRAFFLACAVLGVLALVALATRHTWMPWLGEALVRNDGPAKADIAVVLAGDTNGHRIELAADLVKKGYVPEVLVDGPMGPYGNRESDLAIAFITKEGYPARWFLPLPMDAHSTTEEAAVVVPELERRRINSFLLITSDYHTARAWRTFHKLLQQHNDRLLMRVIPAGDDWFKPDSWWQTREGRKIALLEWTKTIASMVGL